MRIRERRSYYFPRLFSGACRPATRIISILLAVSLAVATVKESRGETPRHLTLEDLHRMFPRAAFQEVNAEQFAELTNDPSMNAVVIVQPPESEPAAISTGQVEQAQSPVPRGMSGQARRTGGRSRRSATEQDHSCFLSVAGDLDVPSRDVAVVIFVIVGVFVVAAAVVYVGYFLYDMTLGDREEYGTWTEFGPRTCLFYGGERAGGMYGIRLAGGFSSDEADVGLAVEGGYIHGDVAVRENDEIVSVSAGYAMLGPTVRWVLSDDFNPLMLEMGLLVGMTSDEDADLISHASAGFSWGMGRSWRMGLTIGGLYLNIREKEGPLRTDSRFNLTGGLQLGFLY